MIFNICLINIFWLIVGFFIGYELRRYQLRREWEDIKDAKEALQRLNNPGKRYTLEEVEKELG